MVAGEIRNGQYRIGGALKYVENGVEQVRMVEDPVLVHDAASTKLSSGSKKIVVNVAAGGSGTEKPEHLVPVLLYVGDLALSRVRKTW
jgi:hypothetical protein